MKDYYKILGVKEDASEEEVRVRWIELTKQYHPDLWGTEASDEKIREINEAYEVLKNEVTRYHYDFERDLKRSFVKKANRDRKKRMNLRKIIIIPCSGILVLSLIVGFFFYRRAEVASPAKTVFQTEDFFKRNKESEKRIALLTPSRRAGSRAEEETGVPAEIKKEVAPPENPQKSPTAAEKESEQKKELPGKILSESNVPASAPPPAKKESRSKELRPQVVMKAERPATKEASGEVRKETPKRVAKEIPKEVSKEAPKPVAKEVPKEAPGEVSREVPKEIPKEVSKEVPKEAPAEIPKEAPEEVGMEVVKEAPKEVTKEIPKEVSKEIPKPIAKETPKEVAKEAVNEAPKESSKEVSRVTLHPGQNLAIWTGEGKAVSSRPSLLAKEEEVKQFFSNYVDRYHRKDVSAFLSLFSKKVVQNQTEGLEAIGNLYAKWIDESEELRYQIEGMKIEIYQNRAEVKARFRVDRKLKKDGAEKVSKGNIRWVLAREEGRLKIISVDY